jgi:tetratricopeptide (TPR) repeat protein
LTFAYTEAGGHVLSLRSPKREWIAWLDDAVAACRVLGRRFGEGHALGDLGVAWSDLGETRKSIEHYEQHLAIAREIGDRRGAYAALLNMAVAHETLGDRMAALDCARESLILIRQIEDPFTHKVEAWIRERGVDPNTIEGPP